jgi:hypothetical protein
VTTSSRGRRFARAGLAVAVFGLALAGAILPGAAAAASTNIGYVRLAHLSPDTPDVDVYLDSASSQIKEQVFKGVGYGVMSGYLKLPVGEYAVSMRVAGADPSTPPVLTTDVTVLKGHAYTVAGVGRHAGLGLKVFNDDLSSPMNGKAKVRIIQASIKEPQLNVSMTDGEKIGSNVSFATTTAYHQVKSGSFSILVTPSGGGKTTKLRVHLQPDSVYSLLILDGKTSLEPDLKVDAGRQGDVPVVAVQTGLGGAAPRSLPVLAVSVLALAGVAFAGIAWTTRRRFRPAVVSPDRAAPLVAARRSDDRVSNSM